MNFLNKCTFTLVAFLPLIIWSSGCSRHQHEVLPELADVTKTSRLSDENLLLEYFWAITRTSSNSEMYYLFIEKYSENPNATNYVTLANQTILEMSEPNYMKSHHSSMSLEEKTYSLSTSLFKDEILKRLSQENILDWRQKVETGEVLFAAYLGRAYGFGWGVEVNEKEALKYNKIACDGGILRSCNSLGFHSENAVEPDVETAKKYYNRACKYGNLMACSNKAAYAEGYTRLLNYSKACLGEYSRACYLLGAELETDESEVRDFTIGEALLRESCKMGYDDACTFLSENRNK